MYTILYTCQVHFSPIKAINKLSKELEKRDMLIPAEIILDAILEDRADLPINAIHMYSGLKTDLPCA